MILPALQPCLYAAGSHLDVACFMLQHVPGTAGSCAALPSQGDVPALHSSAAAADRGLDAATPAGPSEDVFPGFPVKALTDDDTPDFKRKAAKPMLPGDAPVAKPSSTAKNQKDRLCPAKQVSCSQ